jgi:hypothetical protein
MALKNALIVRNDNGTTTTTIQIESANTVDTILSVSGTNTGDQTNISGNAATASNLSYGVGTVNEMGRYLDFHGGTGAATDFDVRLDAGGGTGTTGAGTLNVTASGGLVCSGNVTAFSDERLKKDWDTLPSDFISRLAQVKSGTYTRIDSDERQAGSSAQDWQKLLPEVVQVGSDENNTLSLAYGNAALVSAVELAKRVVELEDRILRLERLLSNS